MKRTISWLVLVAHNGNEQMDHLRSLAAEGSGRARALFRRGPESFVETPVPIVPNRIYESSGRH